MKEEYVSVIVPIYNVEKYLKQCIESILNQTYKKLNIILVNDGSTDNSLKICEEYEKKDNRIEIVNKKNGGLSDARNAGIERACGEYIAFIDADDYVEENYIERLYESCKKNNTKISIAGIKNFDEQTNSNLNEYSFENDDIKCGRDLLVEYYNGKSVQVIVAWNKLYKKELFDNIRFNNGRIHEDEFITYKLLYDLDRISIIKECLYNYRKTPDSIINKKFNKNRLDFLKALEERVEFFSEKKDHELYEKTLLYYACILRNMYIQTKKYIIDSTDEQKNIINKYRKLRLEYLKLSNIKVAKKIKYFIFFCFPNLYYMIYENNF